MNDIDVSTPLRVAARAARLAAGVSQTGAARTIGVSRQSLANWESGRNEPSAAHALVWAVLVGVWERR